MTAWRRIFALGQGAWVDHMGHVGLSIYCQAWMVLFRPLKAVLLTYPEVYRSSEPDYLLPGSLDLYTCGEVRSTAFKGLNRTIQAYNSPTSHQPDELQQFYLKEADSVLGELGMDDFKPKPVPISIYLAIDGQSYMAHVIYPGALPQGKNPPSRRHH
eukprot:gene2951-3236_t